jgi:hypothetical protein
MTRSLFRLFVLILCLLLFSGCSLLQPEPTATPTITPKPTLTLVPTKTYTVTPSPTATLPPTATFTPTPISPEDLVARNNLGDQTRTSVQLEILRLLIANKEILLTGHPQVAADKIIPTRFGHPIFDDKPVVGEIILRATNLGDEIYTLFPSELTFQILGTQIRLEDYILAEAYNTKGANPYNPDILPGSTLYLVYWFGIEDYELSEITELVIALEAPYEIMYDGGWLDTGQFYYFKIDLTERIFEPMPDELYEALY